MTALQRVTSFSFLSDINVNENIGNVQGLDCETTSHEQWAEYFTCWFEGPKVILYDVTVQGQLFQKIYVHVVLYLQDKKST